MKKCLFLFVCFTLFGIAACSDKPEPAAQQQAQMVPQEQQVQYAQASQQQPVQYVQQPVQAAPVIVQQPAHDSTGALVNGMILGHLMSNMGGGGGGYQRDTTVVNRTYVNRTYSAPGRSYKSASRTAARSAKRPASRSSSRH